MKDDLGTRMKTFYEQRTKYKLPRRTWTIIRLDGKAFHTFTKAMRFNKPFDSSFHNAMDSTMTSLANELQGCFFGYTQSDEISLVLKDFQKLNSDAWFDGNIQKIASISSSFATGYFGRQFPVTAPLAFFDSRVFSIPQDDEVLNYLIWRWKDARKNSISMFAQNLFSHKELMGKSGNEKIEMCKEEYGQDWDDISLRAKQGSMLFKEQKEFKDNVGNPFFRSKFVLEPACNFIGQRKFIMNKLSFKKLDK